MAKDKPLPQAGPELAEYTTAAQPKAYADGVPVFCAHDAIIPLKDLRPNPKNPNQHPPEQIKLLASIIRATGLARAHHCQQAQRLHRQGPRPHDGRRAGRHERGAC